MDALIDPKFFEQQIGPHLNPLPQREETFALSFRAKLRNLFFLLKTSHRCI